jgi:hypothetical protein
MNRQELHRLARLGAQARMQELQREMAAIVRQFPDLERAHGGVRPRKRTNGRAKRRISAAARKAISKAQKLRWAAWRKEQTRTN